MVRIIIGGKGGIHHDNNVILICTILLFCVILRNFQRAQTNTAAFPFTAGGWYKKII